MRVAVVLNPVSSGGISRVVKRLLVALLEHTDCEIGLFAGRMLVERDDWAAVAERHQHLTIHLLETFGVEMTSAPSVADQQASGRPALGRLRTVLKRSASIRRLYLWLRRTRGIGGREWFHFRLPVQAVERIRDYDLVYVASPSFIEPFRIDRPIVGTFYDFNWKHDFEGNFNPEMEYLLEAQVRGWMKRYDSLVLISDFTAGELELFYPGTRFAKRVIRYATFGQGQVPAEAVRTTLGDLGLPERYLLYVSGVSVHKNLEGLVRALVHLKRDGYSAPPLVVTGNGSALIGRRPDACLDGLPQGLRDSLVESGLRIGDEVIGLGYLPDEQVDAVIQGATLLIAPSFYEGSAGPAYDAWAAGVPVALSRIPTFLEHMERFGAEAWMFDPSDPSDIARVIRSAIEDPEESRRMCDISLAAMSRYTWADVAHAYHEVFAQAAAAKGKHFD